MYLSCISILSICSLYPKLMMLFCGLTSFLLKTSTYDFISNTYNPGNIIQEIQLSFNNPLSGKSRLALILALTKERR